MRHNDPAILATEIRALLGKRLGEKVESLPGDASLAEALGDRYDSLAALECITEVESRFDIEVDFVDHDVRHWFSTIDRIAQFVQAELEDRELLGGRG